MNNFMQFVEFANNFTKFLELASKFYEVCRSCKQLCKVRRSEKKLYKVHKICKQLYKVCWTLRSFWIGRLDLSAWKFFLYLSFTHSNIFLGKNKCFVNTFHVSWILFTKKLNRGHYVRVDKIFGTVKKWSLVTLDRWLFCAV